MNIRKQNVILTAKQLFATKGYNNSSVQDIIDECGISKGTFYNYFDSKNEFLIAYLNTAREEEFQRREALLYRNDRSNKDVFVKQVLIRIEIVNEYTLRPIHEATIYSEDVTLKTYIQRRYVEELKWLAGRLLDIYGKKSSPYVSDGAILMHGMIQNMLHAWSILTNKKLNLTLLAQYVVRRMDHIIDHLIQSEDFFLHDIELTSFNKKTENNTKENIIHNLLALHQSLHETELALQQHTEFLIEELQLEQPRVYLLHSFSHILNKISDETAYKKQVTFITNQLKNYLAKK